MKGITFLMKKTWVRKTLSIGVLAAGALLLGPAAAAQADGWNDGIAQQSVGNFGVANGNQFAFPINMPVNECGNSTALGGISYAAAACTNAIGVDGRKSIVTKVRKSESFDSAKGFDSSKNLLGNNLLGNAAHQLAHGSPAGHKPSFGHVSPDFGHGKQFNHVSPSWGHIAPSFGHVSPGLGQGMPSSGVDFGGHNGHNGQSVGGDWDDIKQTSVGNFGYLNGNQVAAPINMPINVCGNSLSLLGASYSQASCSNVIGGKVKHVKPVKGHDNDGDVAGDNDGYPSKDDDGDVRGDNGYNAGGEAPDTAGYGDEAPDTADYGDEIPTGGEMPTGDAQDDKGYGGEKPANYGDKGGRGESANTTLKKVTNGDLDALRGAGLGGLGVLNTLR